MKRRRGVLLAAMAVLILCMAYGVRLHFQQQQYARNRQLIYALTHNDTKAALALVNEGADPNTRAESTPAPSLRLLLKLLLHHGSSPVNHSPTALMLACGSDWSTATRADENLLLIQAMLAHGASLHARRDYNYTALSDAVGVERLHTVELLLQHGADINVQDESGKTPLMDAIFSKKMDMMRLLLKYGANPDARDAFGGTALCHAVNSLYANRVIPELLAHGADPNLSKKDGRTPVMLAQELNLHDIVDLLKRGGRR